MRWRLLLLAYSSLICFGLADNSRGPLYPELLKEFTLTPRAGAWIFALASLAGLCSNITSSRWLPLLSQITWMRLTIFFMGIGTYLLGMAGSINQVELIWVSAIIFGLGAGMNGILMNVMVAHAAPSNLRRRAFAIFHALYGISSLMAPFYYQLWTEQIGGWDGYFKVLLIPNLIVLVASFFVSQDEVPKTPHRHQQNKLPLSLLIHWAATIGVYVCSEVIVSSRLVLYLREAHNYSPEDAAKGLSFFFFALMLGRLSLGIFSVPYKGEALMKGSLIATTALLVLAFCGFPLALSLSAFTMAPFFPAAMDLISENFPENLEAMTSAIMAGVGASLVIMHLSFGQIATFLGVSWAMGLALALSLLSFLGVITLPLKVKKTP